MKTAISISDELFAEADRLAARLKKSRSEVYREALEDYVARHDADEVRDALDRVLATLDEAGDEFTRAAAARVLERTEW